MRSDINYAFKGFTTTFSTKDIIAVLRTNLSKHCDAYEAALLGYRKDAVAALKEKIARVESGEVTNLGINVNVPRDYSEEYVKFIAQLEMCTDDTIELTMEQAGCIIHDDWDWKSEFNRVATSYSTSGK